MKTLILIISSLILLYAFTINNEDLELDSYKIIKKIELLAFSNKTKTISAFVPEKVNNYLNSFFGNEISFFEKTYKFKINIITDNSLIIPEYKIHLFNKSKKLINKVESVKIIENKSSGNIIKIPKIKRFETEQGKNSKKNNKSLGKTLWVRRKKAKSN